MHIVVVHIHVKPELVEAFVAATLENAKNSKQEPGIARFDFLQRGDDPARFILYEAYYSPEDQLKHRETEHYKKWKATVENMMAEPREGIKYANVYPMDKDW